MISITIHIEGEPSEMEARILAAIAGQRPEPAIEEAIAQGEREAFESYQPPKRTRRTRAEMEAARAADNLRPEEDPVVEATHEPEPVVDEPPVKETVHAVPTGATLEDAVKLATDLVAANRVTELKNALTDMGAKRVSELKGDQIGVFLGKFAA